MKIKALAAAAMLATAGFAAPSQAAVIPFLDVVAGPAVISYGSSYNFSHNIADPGPLSVNLGSDTILSALLNVVLQDVGGPEQVEISFDLGPFLPVTGDVPDIGQNYAFNLGDISGSLIASLQTDGILDVTLQVTSVGSSVIFSNSTLTGTADRVPEPAAMFLIGSGLAALGLMRRKAQKA